MIRMPSPEDLERAERYELELRVLLGEVKDASDPEHARTIVQRVTEFIGREGPEASHIMVMVFSAEIAASMRATTAGHVGPFWVAPDRIPDASPGVVRANEVCAAVANGDTVLAASISAQMLYSTDPVELGRFLAFFIWAPYQLANDFTASPVEFRGCCGGQHE